MHRRTHSCTAADKFVNNSAWLCAHLLGKPLPNPLPKDIGEYEAFLRSGRVPVSGLLYETLTRTFPLLADKLMDMGLDQSFLVTHFTSSIELSLSRTLPTGGSYCLIMPFKLILPSRRRIVLQGAQKRWWLSTSVAASSSRLGPH